MIVLTGVTGGLGRALLQTILEKNLINAGEIIISSSNPNSPKLQTARDAGITIRHGDMLHPETLVTSHAGAEALYLTSYPSVGEERFIYHKAAIDAAKQVGIKHIIYTSLTFGGPTGEHSVGGVMQAHINTVNYLKRSGLTWTIVREATYAHLWNNFAGFMQVGDREVKEIVISADGPNSWADRNELGEATAYVVANWRDYINKTVNLTGPELLTAQRIVDMYTSYIGRPPIHVKALGSEAAIAYHKQAKSLPPEMEDFLPSWASFGAALAAGELNYLDPTFEKLLGRRPKTIQDLAPILFNAETNKLDVKDFN